MDTPEFLLWAVEYRCPIRGLQDGSDPERIERQLRAARAVSDARHERRVFEGFCFDPPYGFNIENALAVYGGLDIVERHCVGCPANAGHSPDALAFAGCYGLLPLTELCDLRLIVERAAERCDSSPSLESCFAPTRPRWYGLWMRSPLLTTQQRLILNLLSATDSRDLTQPDISQFEAGLQTALQAGLPMHVAVYPRGRVEGGWWRLVSHCSRCKGGWTRPDSRRCVVCGHEGPPAPDKKRRARGRRPYFPLDRLLGSQAAADLVVRYEAHRKHPGLRVEEESPLPPMPPNSLRVG